MTERTTSPSMVLAVGVIVVLALALGYFILKPTASDSAAHARQQEAKLADSLWRRDSIMTALPNFVPYKLSVWGGKATNTRFQVGTLLMPAESVTGESCRDNYDTDPPTTVCVMETYLRPDYYREPGQRWSHGYFLEYHEIGDRHIMTETGWVTPDDANHQQAWDALRKSFLANERRARELNAQAIDSVLAVAP